MLEDVTDDLELAHELADLADEITTHYFAVGPVPWRSKADGSPVTAVDLEVEEQLWALVEARWPEDAFLGEEVGALGIGERRWIVDGIDGTHAFASGRREWGTLVALEVDGEIAIGVATSPGLRQRWWAARGRSAWTAPLPGGATAQARRLQVTGRPWFPQARVGLLPPPEENVGWRRAIAERIDTSLSRPQMTNHPALLVAEGDLDLSVQLGGGPWDHAPFVVIVEEAGGQFGDLWGGRQLDTSTAVFANGPVTMARLIEHVAADRPVAPPR